MPKRTLDKDKKILTKIQNNKLPSIEIKGAGDVAFCAGGTHESGNLYLPIGTTELCIIEELGEHINNICKKYKLPVSDVERRNKHIKKYRGTKQRRHSNTDPNYELEENIHEGSRNNSLFNKGREYFNRNKDLLSIDSFRRIIQGWNKKYCKPPLPYFEVDSICNSILGFNGGRL
jgi:hypothetical protein